MTARITFVDSKGVARTVEAAPGVSVMEAATDNKVPEIETDCGGVCTCASCHVYVDPDWAGRFQPMSKNENNLLALLETRRANSRLSCQLKMTEALDGLTVHTLDPDAVV
ncbi:MAG: 2Fe-2S iron-sulfur cluster-binding protein [Caulobacterales bacterium]